MSRKKFLLTMLIVVTTGPLFATSAHAQPSPAAAVATPSEPPADPPAGVDDTDPSVTGIATPPPASVSEPVATRAGAPVYRFGTEPYRAVQAAAAAATVTCDITPAEIVNLVLAPTYFETGAGSTATPSPMTLSRYDRDIGLHSLSDAARYTRVFWHPGIGAWQFDGAGLWGKTADERINVAQIAPLAVSVMVGRFCNARLDGQLYPDARVAAWRPWVACRTGGRCESAYASLTNDGVITDDAVSNLGGMTQSTCRLPGAASSVACRRVDPALAQGYQGSWTGTPNGSASVAPLSYPFSVLSSGGNEWRLWSAADTGYGVDIAASKPLAANPRARANSARPCENISPIKWYVNGALVDSIDRSACGAGPSATTTAVAGDTGSAKALELRLAAGDTHRALVGNFVVDARDFPGDRNARDDVFLYAAGSRPDYLVRFDDNEQPISTPLAISGSYQPLVGDFDGNGFDDIFWYAPGGESDSVWWSNGQWPNPFTSTTINVNGVYQPIIGDVTGNGRTEIFWYAPGPNSDSLWQFSAGRAITGKTLNIHGAYQPVVADIFKGIGGHEIIWWNRSGADSVWDFSPSADVHSTAIEAPNASQPVVGDYDFDGAQDVFWLGNGSLPDGFWWGSATRSVTKGAANVQGSYVGLAADLDGNSRDELVLFGAGTGFDTRWVLDDRTISSRALRMDQSEAPQVFNVDAVLNDDFLFFRGLP